MSSTQIDPSGHSAERAAWQDMSTDEVVEMTAEKKREVSDDLALLEKRKQHHETQKRLEAEKKACQERKLELQKEREILNHKNEVLEQKIKEHNDLMERQQKLAAESAKSKGDTRKKGKAEETQTIEKEIEEKRKMLTEINRQRLFVKADVDRYLVYKNFLERVEEKLADGTVVEELMKRYRTLKTEEMELEQEIANIKEDKNITAQTHNEDMKTKRGRLLQLNTELEQKQNYLKDLRLEVKKKETSLFSLDDHAIQQKETSSTVAMSIRNLVEQARKGTSLSTRLKDQSKKPTSSTAAGGGGGAGGAQGGGSGAGSTAAPGSATGGKKEKEKDTLLDLLKTIKETMEELQYIIDHRPEVYNDLSKIGQQRDSPYNAQHLLHP